MGFRKTRWNNLSGGLAASVTAGPSGQDLTSSIVPRGTSFHRWVELDLLLLHLILHRSQAAATSLVHRNSVPSTHMRCIITAKRRASATRLLQPAVAGNLHRPGLEPGPLRRAHQ